MIEIRNLMFQPLTLHMTGEEGGVHLGSRERKTIADAQLSDEIRSAADRGFVTVADVPESTQPDPRVPKSSGQVEPADGEPCPEPSRRDRSVPGNDNQAVARQRKRRQA